MVRQEKEIKEVLIGKEEVKLFLFTDDVILYLRDAKNSTRKCLEMINSFNKVSGYKINLKKSVDFLYVNNEKLEEYMKPSNIY